MPSSHLATLLASLATFRSAFSQPSFFRFLLLTCGWLLVQGPAHSVTEALLAADVAHRCHWEAFHRFFSRGTWAPDRLGRLLLPRLEPWRWLDGLWMLVIDDSLCPKKGPEIFGLGCHLDAVRSTRKTKAFAFGHAWVVLSVVVRLPFSSRPWALPVMLRLYRSKKTCPEKDYATKNQLARQMLDRLLRWLPEGKVRLLLDLGYSNQVLLKGLPARVSVIGALRDDAALTTLPVKTGRGRPRKKGTPLPKPREMAQQRQRWSRTVTEMYGQQAVVRYLSVVAQWYGGAGPSPLRIVVVKTDRGQMPVRVFFSTDADLAVEEVLHSYACRWSQEVWFRDAKQWLGWADSSARLRASVLRVAPWVALVSSALVLWFAELPSGVRWALVPQRPWWPSKRNLAMSDVVAAARSVLRGADLLDVCRESSDRLKNRSDRPPLAAAALIERRKPSQTPGAPSARSTASLTPSSDGSSATARGNTGAGRPSSRPSSGPLLPVDSSGTSGLDRASTASRTPSARAARRVAFVSWSTPRRSGATSSSGPPRARARSALVSASVSGEKRPPAVSTSSTRLDAARARARPTRLARSIDRPSFRAARCGEMGRRNR